jgi:hypothetical protein
MWPARSGPNGFYDPRAGFAPKGLLRYAPHNFGLEYRWRGLELAGGNYYVLAAIAFVAATASWLAATRHRPPTAARTHVCSPADASHHDCSPANASHIPIYPASGYFSS